MGLLLDLHTMMYFQLRVIVKVGKPGGSGSMGWVPGVSYVTLFCDGNQILPEKDPSYSTTHPKYSCHYCHFRVSASPAAQTQQGRRH